jgi:hypothetical protein
LKPFGGSVVLLNTPLDAFATRGLDGFVGGQILQHRVPGKHSDMLIEPAVQVVAEILQPYLAS